MGQGGNVDAADGETRRFANGYEVTLGPPRGDGCRDVRVHDHHGRASGHTAVASAAEFEALAERVAGRPAAQGRRLGTAA